MKLVPKLSIHNAQFDLDAKDVKLSYVVACIIV